MGANPVTSVLKDRQIETDVRQAQDQLKRYIYEPDKTLPLGLQKCERINFSCFNSQVCGYLSEHTPEARSMFI